MLMTSKSNLATQLAERRTALGMTYTALAERSGVSEPTIKRILGGRIAGAQFDHVIAIAGALGMPLNTSPIDAHDLRMQAATEKATRMARMVQGTSALESQAVDQDEVRRLIERSVHELMAGPSRYLWST